MDKVAKLILNSLKCPVCSGQIDLISGVRLDSKAKGQNFSCVYDPEHYSIRFVHWELPTRIEMEQVVIYEGSYQYHIFQHNWNAGLGIQIPATKIVISTVDPEHRIIDNSKKIKEFTYSKHLFDFKKTDREKLVNRIKTILVFQ